MHLDVRELALHADIRSLDVFLLSLFVLCCRYERTTTVTAVLERHLLKSLTTVTVAVLETTDLTIELFTPLDV